MSIEEKEIRELAEAVLMLANVLPKNIYMSNPVAINLAVRKANTVLSEDNDTLGTKLRIIYTDFNETDFKIYKIANVKELHGCFIVTDTDPKYGVIKGTTLKKNYLHFTVATPEKEELIDSLYEKINETEDFRVSVVTKVFSEWRTKK